MNCAYGQTKTRRDDAVSGRAIGDGRRRRCSAARDIESDERLAHDGDEGDDARRPRTDYQCQQREHGNDIASPAAIGGERVGVKAESERNSGWRNEGIVKAMFIVAKSLIENGLRSFQLSPPESSDVDRHSPRTTRPQPAGSDPSKPTAGEVATRCADPVPSDGSNSR